MSVYVCTVWYVKLFTTIFSTLAKYKLTFTSKEIKIFCNDNVKIFFILIMPLREKNFSLNRESKPGPLAHYHYAIQIFSTLAKSKLIFTSKEINTYRQV